MPFDPSPPAAQSPPAADAPESHAFKAAREVPARQNRMHSGLGADLRKARRTARRTQSDVAVQAACSVLAVRQAEVGRGAFSVFASLAAACGMAVDAKSAPPGDALGPRLLALRRRLGLGRRAAATLADISATTVAAIERGAACHTDAVARLAAALGVPLRLVPVGAQAGFWQAAGTASSYHGWTTPSWLLYQPPRCLTRWGFPKPLDFDSLSGCRRFAALED